VDGHLRNELLATILLRVGGDAFDEGITCSHLDAREKYFSLNELLAPLDHGIATRYPAWSLPVTSLV
jgi:hypothetical protein